MTERRTVRTDAAPAAIGPYSQAVVAGELVFTSGQIALDPATGAMVGDDVEAQTRQVFANLKAVLDAAGTSLGRVVRCDVFLADMEEFARMNAVYAEHFPHAPPARVTVEAARLPKDARVEIAAIALGARGDHR